MHRHGSLTLLQREHLSRDSFELVLHRAPQTAPVLGATARADTDAVVVPAHPQLPTSVSCSRRNTCQRPREQPRGCLQSPVTLVLPRAGRSRVGDSRVWGQLVALVPHRPLAQQPLAGDTHSSAVAARLAHGDTRVLVLEPVSSSPAADSTHSGLKAAPLGIDRLGRGPGAQRPPSPHTVNTLPGAAGAQGHSVTTSTRSGELVVALTEHLSPNTAAPGPCAELRAPAGKPSPTKQRLSRSLLPIRRVCCGVGAALPAGWGS